MPATRVGKSVKHIVEPLVLVGDGSSEQQDVRFWLMQHVVDPSRALLNSEVTPFSL